MKTDKLGDILCRAAELSEKNRNDEAAKVLSSAINSFSATGTPASILHYNYGLVLAALGNSDSALEEFRKAAELNPHDADAWNEIGRILIDEGKPGAARNALNRALELQPANAAAWNNLGVVCFLQERYSDAAAAFESAVENDPLLADAWYNLADARDENGDKQGGAEARARFRELSRT